MQTSPIVMPSPYFTEFCFLVSSRGLSLFSFMQMIGFFCLFILIFSKNERRRASRSESRQKLVLVLYWLTMMLVATLVVALLTLVSLPRVSSLPFSNASPRAPHLVPHESLRTFDRRLGGADNEDKDVIDLCREFYYDSILDHFSWSAGGERYKQRVFICDVYWKDRTLQKYEEEPSNSDGKSRKGPIFFYTGNEADVTLYLNETGFMWEFAQEVGALLGKNEEERKVLHPCSLFTLSYASHRCQIGLER